MKNVCAYLLVFSFLLLGSLALQAQYTGSLDLLLDNSDNFNIYFKNPPSNFLEGSISYSNTSSNDLLTLRAGTGTGDLQHSITIKRVGGVEIDGDLSINGNDDLNFGSTTRQMINLWNQSYGIGVQSSTQYYRSDKNFAWYRGGSHRTGELDPGTGGTMDMVLKNGVLGIGVSNSDLNTDVQAHIGGDMQVDGEILSASNATVGDLALGVLPSASGWAFLGHKDLDHETTYQNFAFAQNQNGNTYFNCPPSALINFSMGTLPKMQIISSGDVQIRQNLQIADALVVGSLSTSDRISGAIAHFDGRVYISEEGGSERGFTNTAHENYGDYLLWAEEGIVSKDIALADPAVGEGWPDYVFAEDYNLSSLSYVEDFIKLNGHLPTMPSAGEVGLNGYTVNDMTKRLLQTIEELTLHTIEQEKQLEEQQAKFDAQQQLIERLMERMAQLEQKATAEK